MKKLTKLKRVVAYIDGFNLYFGLKSKGWKDCYWLNIQSLVQKLLKSDQTLVMTKYFTARVSKQPEKQRKQGIFIEALSTLKDFEIFYGRYLITPYKCRKCGSTYDIPKEKMTDVNIAIEILTDASQDVFDEALLISADSDLKPAVARVKKLFPEKRLIIVFPPARSSVVLKNIADGCFVIWRKTLIKSLFSKSVKKSDGFILRCPDSWR